MPKKLANFNHPQLVLTRKLKGLWSKTDLYACKTIGSKETNQSSIFGSAAKVEKRSF